MVTTVKHCSLLNMLWAGLNILYLFPFYCKDTLWIWRQLLRLLTHTCLSSCLQKRHPYFSLTLPCRLGNTLKIRCWLLSQRFPDPSYRALIKQWWETWTLESGEMEYRFYHVSIIRPNQWLDPLNFKFLIWKVKTIVFILWSLLYTLNDLTYIKHIRELLLYAKCLNLRHYQNRNSKA